MVLGSLGSLSSAFEIPDILKEPRHRRQLFANSYVEAFYM